MSLQICSANTRARLHKTSSKQWIAAVRRHHELPARALHVAAIIADFVNRKHGCAWPSAAMVAKAAGLTERWARHLIRLLEQSGLLAIDKRPGKSNVYRLVIGQAVVNTPRPQKVATKKPVTDTALRKTLEHVSRPLETISTSFMRYLLAMAPNPAEHVEIRVTPR